MVISVRASVLSTIVRSKVLPLPTTQVYAPGHLNVIGMMILKIKMQSSTDSDKSRILTASTHWSLSSKLPK